MASYKPVTAVLRGIEVLKLVNRGAPTTVRTIHHATGFDKATIVRMLQTLIHAGYVTQDETTGTYSVTGRVLQLSVGYSTHDRIAALCTPILSELRQSIGWPSDFAIRDAESMILVQTSRTQGPLLLNRRPGFRAPMLVTSIGRAYLAACAPGEMDEIMALLANDPAQGRLPKPHVLQGQLAAIREAGYAVMDDSYSRTEYGAQLWALAVPVADGDHVYGALNIMLLRDAVDEATVTERYLPRLQDTARALLQAFRDENI